EFGACFRRSFSPISSGGAGSRSAGWTRLGGSTPARGARAFCFCHAELHTATRRAQQCRRPRAWHPARGAPGRLTAATCGVLMPPHPRERAPGDAPMAPPTSLSQPHPLGFTAGVHALFRGFSYVLGAPRTWPYACVPALVLLVLLGAAGWATARWVFPAIQAALPSAESSAGQMLWLGTSGLLAIGVFLLGASLAFALTPPLASPALERIVTLRERSLAVPDRPPIGFFAEIWCGCRAQVFVLIAVVPVLALLWLVELLLPPLVVVTTPLKLIVTSWALAWNLLDYPLTLRGVRMRERYLLFS